MLRPLWRGTLIALLLAGVAQAGMIDSYGDPSDLALGLGASTGYRPSRALGVGCVSVDPTRAASQHPLSSLDQPACALATTPAVENRDLFRVAHADLAMTLGYVGDAQPGSGLVRLLASFSHFLTAGPLAGWQFRANAQVARPPNLSADSQIDERVKLFLGAKPIEGWNLHFDAIATSRGSFTPGMAADRNLEVAADISRILIVPGWGQGHSIDLRLSEGSAQDRFATTAQQATRATLGYSHNLGLGSLGADLALAHFAPGEGAAAHTEARTEIKFYHPF
jgi:hypothetical protein